MKNGTTVHDVNRFFLTRRELKSAKYLGNDAA